MFPTIAHAVRSSQQHIVKLDEDRIKEGRPAEFDSLRDGMLWMNCAWQDLCLTVRKDNGDLIKASASAIKLAAAAIKFASDLSNLTPPSKKEIQQKELEMDEDD